MRKITILLAAFLLLGLMAACGGKTNNPATPGTTNTGTTNTGTTNTGTTNTGTANTGTANTGNKTTADAEAVYKAQCVGCHAADLSGGVGPNLQKVGAQKSQDQITAQIQNGGGGMPPFKSTLSADEITALSQWLAGHK